jgi:ABC-2 type transport system ATP-binding protein
MIEVKGLVKTYGSKRAVDGVTFTVRPGDILGFLGPNGAGKSTTMKMITGFIRPDAGTATVAGIDVTQDPVAVKSRIGYLPESAPAYGGDVRRQEFLGVHRRGAGLPRSPPPAGSASSNAPSASHIWTQ